MATMEVTVSWATQVQDANLRGWRVYASLDGDTRGSLVTEEPASARSSTFEIEEGEYHFTVVPVTTSDVEGPWEKSRARERVFVPGRTQEAPSAPTTVAVQQVSPDVGARVTVDPVPPNEDADRVQVIEGSDPETGKILAEVPVPKAGPRAESAPLPSVNIPMDGSAEGATPTTRALQVRTVTKGGVPSPPVSRTVVMPERAQMHRAPIASILTAGGGSTTGFPTPDGSLFFTHVGADGFKTTRLPAGNDSAGWALLGAADTGSRFTGMRLTPYPQFVKIESNEIDLGSDVVFSLECFDQVQRVTAAGLLPSIPGWALSLYPGAPGLVRDIDDDNTLGPAWLTRCMSGEGKLRFPIRQVRWEYVASASSSVPHADGDYVPVVPGAWISGRFVRVRLVITDPLGWHQIKTGNVRVNACIQRVDRSGAGTPETFVQGPPGSRYTDTTNDELWVKKTGLFTTGWVPATPTMVGDSGSGGKRGAVPAPASGDAAAGKFLKADGTWAVPGGGGGASAGRLLKVTVLTGAGSGSHSLDADTDTVVVEIVAGGGGGGGVPGATAGQSAVGGGGASGGFGRRTYTGVNGIPTVDYTIGSGGSAGSSGGGSGGAGNDTTFDDGADFDATPMVAKGGSGGGATSESNTLGMAAGGAPGGASTGCDLNGAGNPGSPGVKFSATLAAGGVGAGSVFGGGGVPGFADQAGSDGTAPGAGGGGAASNSATANHRGGGAGITGAIVIYEYSA